jgi:hypothetical protein
VGIAIRLTHLKAPCVQSGIDEDHRATAAPQRRVAGKDIREVGGVATKEVEVRRAWLDSDDLCVRVSTREPGG